VRVLLAGSVVLVLGAVAGPYVYIHFIEGDPPKPLTFETTSPTPSKSRTAPSAPIGVAGVWTVSAGSTVGYRVHETLVGQNNTAVGRTTAVTGNLSITDTSVRSAAFTVDVTNMASDAAARDRSYARIMQTATFPTAEFTLTRPITLAKIPADLQQISAPVTGNLTLHGVTRPVTVNLKARRNGSKIEVNGLIPIAFTDYRITNPSLPGIKVGNIGDLEFLLVFART
jgi:polyisoprenoid-binding protein YceI